MKLKGLKEEKWSGLVSKTYIEQLYNSKYKKKILKSEDHIHGRTHLGYHLLTNEHTEAELRKHLIDSLKVCILEKRRKKGNKKESPNQKRTCGKIVNYEDLDKFPIESYNKIGIILLKIEFEERKYLNTKEKSKEYLKKILDEVDKRIYRGEKL